MKLFSSSWTKASTSGSVSSYSSNQNSDISERVIKMRIPEPPAAACGPPPSPYTSTLSKQKSSMSLQQQVSAQPPAKLHDYLQQKHHQLLHNIQLQQEELKKGKSLVNMELLFYELFHSIAVSHQLMLVQFAASKSSATPTTTTVTTMVTSHEAVTHSDL